MLCVEDYIAALEWGKSLGGLSALIGRADANAGVLAKWVERTSWIEHLAVAPENRSNTSVCLKLSDAAVANLSPDEAVGLPKRMVKLLADEGVALDIGGYRDAPAGLRIWCGATVETSDVEALTPWLDWAYSQASVSAAA